jgi:flavin reductase (DIM6/NTAB) family NADH-FMN oxidoreductase RutF
MEAAMAISSLDPVAFRRVAGTFATGVTVITAERSPGLVHGMTANSFTSVSLDPLLVLACVSHDARLLSYLKSQRRFGVSILREGQQALSEYFAKLEQTPEEHARLGIRYRWTSSGIPLLDGALAELACNVVAEHAAGDHTIFLGEVESMECHDGEPLLFHRGQYRRLAP